MALLDSDYDILTAPSAYTGDPSSEGYRSLYTLKADNLPATFVTNEQMTNPNYGSSGYPEYSVLLVANSPEVLFQQIDAAVTSAKPGAEDTAVVGAATTTIMCIGGENPAYYRSPASGESQAYSDADLMFFYEIEQTDTSEVLLIRTPEYYHPNAQIQIDRGGTKDVTVLRRLGIAAMYSPGDIQFQTFLSGFTPSEPWHPDSDTGLGIGTIDIYETDGPTLITADTDWAAILAAVGVKQAF